MASVQPASLQLFQKLAESMLGTGAAGKQFEDSAGAETVLGSEVPTLGASVGLGTGEDPGPVCGRGLWTEVCSGLCSKQTGMMAQLTPSIFPQPDCQYVNYFLFFPINIRYSHCRNE